MKGSSARLVSHKLLTVCMLSFRKYQLDGPIRTANRLVMIVSSQTNPGQTVVSTHKQALIITTIATMIMISDKYTYCYRVFFLLLCLVYYLSFFVLLLFIIITMSIVLIPTLIRTLSPKHQRRQRCFLSAGCAGGRGQAAQRLPSAALLVCRVHGARRRRGGMGRMGC
jgi:hypothetical protein